MKIDTTIKNVTATRSKDAKTGKTQTVVLTPGGVAVSDDVRLTDTSAKMRGLEAELAQIDVADAMFLRTQGRGYPRRGIQLGGMALAVSDRQGIGFITFRTGNREAGGGIESAGEQDNSAGS